MAQEAPGEHPEAPETPQRAPGGPSTDSGHNTGRFWSGIGASFGKIGRCYGPGGPWRASRSPRDAPESP
eukprot:2115005-Pyramimonas_sp.AAC.1